MNIPQISFRAQQVLGLPDATAADILSAREAGIFCRAFLMMESNLSPQSTAHQHGEILRVKATLRALSAEFDARLA